MVYERFSEYIHPLIRDKEIVQEDTEIDPFLDEEDE